MRNEGKITHNTVGRVNVERGENAVTIRLWQWSLKPDATLSFAEAKALIRKLEDAMRPTSASVATEDDPYDVG